MPDNHHLVLRRRTWYVRVAVRPSLVPIIGQTHIVRSLKTRDAAIARQRRWAALAEIHAQIAEKAGKSVDHVKMALEARQSWLRASDDPRDGYPFNPENPDDDRVVTPRDEIEHVFVDTAEQIERLRGPQAAGVYYRIATSKSPVISEVAEAWLGEITASVTAQTLGHHRFALKAFQGKHPELLFIAQVNRTVAGSFVSEVLLKSGRSQRTANRIISSLSACWKWLIKRGMAEVNPWLGQGNYRKSKKGDKRPFTAEELVLLLKGSPEEVLTKRYGPAVRDLIRLGLMTGARLNELCELRREHISAKDKAIRIVEGKTESAVRIIPVHEAIWGIVEKRSKEARDGQLFPELTPQGPDQKRSWYVSKRITLYRRRVLGEDDTVDFHSLRRSFATYLERAQAVTLPVNHSVIADLMGHTKGSMALSLYSGGLRLRHLIEAIDSLPQVIEPEVMAALIEPSDEALGCSSFGMVSASGLSEPSSPSGAT